MRGGSPRRGKLWLIREPGCTEESIHLDGGDRELGVLPTPNLSGPEYRW